MAKVGSVRPPSWYFSIVTSACVCLGLATPAGARSLTYSVSLDQLTQPGLLPQFNPALGTLNEVTINAEGSVENTFVFPDLTTNWSAVAFVDVFAVIGDGEPARWASPALLT